MDLANALDTSSYALINVAGPAVAGVLFGVVGAQATLLVIVLLYTAATVCLLPLVRRTLRPARDRDGSLVSEALAGVVYFVRHVSFEASPSPTPCSSSAGASSSSPFP